MSKTVHIVFLGEAGFPIGLGAVQRMTLMSKSLLVANCKVTVLCRKGILNSTNSAALEPKGTFEGIDYIYTSGTVRRPKRFLKRNSLKLKGMIAEFNFLYRKKRSNELTAAIISNHSALHVLRYKIYAKLIGFPIVLNFVELASSMKGRESISVRINDKIFDNYIVRIVDGALPISEKLKDHYKRFSPSKPCLKLPIICEFEKFDLKSESDLRETNFLYCGAASYFELVDFLITAFDQLENPGKYVYFKLILGGKKAELNKVRKRIKDAKNSVHIKLITNVPHNDIPQHYSNASALLIPLRPTLQDEARFPHKIGEYLASGRPVITTAYGEINHYEFLDEKTALVAAEYSVDSFAKKMKFILDHPEKSREIGIKGREMGLKNFDYTKYGTTLGEFLNSFANKRN